MCFNATVSVGAGLVIGSVGVATLPLVRDRRELLFAALPVGFGLHQLLEGIIWTQLDASVDHAVRGPAVLAWLFYAWLLLPIWVPISVWLMEPDRRRRPWMLGFGVVGTATGVYLYFQAITAPAAVVVMHSHLHYSIPTGPPWSLAVPYVAATCIPLLLCTKPFVVWFGVGLTLAMAATAVLDAMAFSSVWCFFAAALSVGLLAHYATTTRGFNADSGRRRLPRPAQ